jgi:hypothetical protein
MLYNKHLYDNGEGALWLANLELSIQFSTQKDGLPKGVGTAYCPGQPIRDYSYNGKHSGSTHSAFLVFTRPENPSTLGTSDRPQTTLPGIGRG